MYYDTENQCWPLDYSPPLVSKKPRKWPAITPDMHEKIKRLYQEKSGHSGQVRDFAQRHGLPRWKITRYAQAQGWICKQKKEPSWSEAELRILNRSARHCPRVIQGRLKKAGYHRTETGIIMKLKRLRLRQNLEGQSARQIALCLGEDVHFVMRAIRSGQLKASRRQTNRTSRQGGDPYYITDKDIRDFVINHLYMIDLRKVDKYWFVDLLAEGKR